MFPKKSYYREFLRCYLSSRSFYEGINNKGDRSAQAGFNQSDMNSFELNFPLDESIVERFEQRLQLKKENQYLSNLRDTLLPKLMSGELDVSDIDHSTNNQFRFCANIRNSKESNKKKLYFCKIVSSNSRG